MPLEEELPEATDGIYTIWLTESGQDAKEREKDIALLKGSDFQFRNLKRIVKDMFDKSISKTYESKDVSQFELGYRAALRDLHKIIPQTKSK